MSTFFYTIYFRSIRVRDFILDIILPPSPKELQERKIIRTLTPSKLFQQCVPAHSCEKEFISALFSYKDSLIHILVWHLKYKKNQKAVEIIATALFMSLLEQASEIHLLHGNKKPLLIPIPLSKKRQALRGFNQSQEIIKKIKTLDIEGFFAYSQNLLIRYRHTKPQTKIKNRSERIKNMKNCFRVTNAAAIKNNVIILIDDVTTTGATLSEARKALIKAGAVKVYGVTFAH